MGKPSWYVTSHPGQLSQPWVGAMSTSESWDVKATERCAQAVVVVRN